MARHWMKRTVKVAVVAGGLLAAPAMGWAHDGEEGHFIPHDLPGIHLDGGVTWVFQGTDKAPGGDSGDLSYSLDLSLSSRISEHGTVNIALEGGNGAGVDARLNSLSIANYDAYVTAQTNDANNGINTPSISQLYYEGDYWDGRMVVEFGKLDVHGKYDDNAYANNETDQFLGRLFVRSEGTGYAELDQYYAPGLAINLAPGENLSLMVVGANGHGAGFDGVTEYGYGAAQLTLTAHLAEREGHYRVYNVYDGRHYTKLNGAIARYNLAWGVSLDQALPANLGVFARYTSQDDNLVENLVTSTWSGGVVLAGNAWGRDNDVFGVGYGSVNVSGNAAVLANAGIANAGDETHLEAYYKVAISEHFTLSPDVQWIKNNGGSADAPDVTVYGVRGQMNF